MSPISAGQGWTTLALCSLPHMAPVSLHNVPPIRRIQYIATRHRITKEEGHPLFGYGRHLPCRYDTQYSIFSYHVCFTP
ncbi:uncharacterized protein M421DRAFT_278692 [Didymella exigua CBS 183.55]|uniref:Uncharacterized protein n=1 Tax=Didymella exigua CBS 183.55 TaxID=1150837 RepID=A0A6A5RAT8_9PLEO|nr:uncharacterized protein M421DRAFT_278692 [Didymella exigua CBS 183.55]KAF1924429.1 hypothetical protein M421DRAFT_278692 [Didymella exigua CBS 183.55]